MLLSHCVGMGGCCVFGLEAVQEHIAHRFGSSCCHWNKDPVASVDTPSRKTRDAARVCVRLRWFD